MKTKFLTGSLCLVALLALVGFTYQGRPWAQWAYKIETLTVSDDKHDAAYLSGLGLDGWELVGTERDGGKRTYLLKRPLR